jgi:hypothetical protein
VWCVCVCDVCVCGVCVWCVCVCVVCVVCGVCVCVCGVCVCGVCVFVVCVCGVYVCGVCVFVCVCVCAVCVCVCVCVLETQRMRRPRHNLDCIVTEKEMFSSAVASVSVCTEATVSNQSVRPAELPLGTQMFPQFLRRYIHNAASTSRAQCREDSCLRNFHGTVIPRLTCGPANEFFG